MKAAPKSETLVPFAVGSHALAEKLPVTVVLLPASEMTVDPLSAKPVDPLIQIALSRTAIDLTFQRHLGRHSYTSLLPREGMRLAYACVSY